MRLKGLSVVVVFVFALCVTAANATVVRKERRQLPQRTSELSPSGKGWGVEPAGPGGMGLGVEQTGPPVAPLAKGNGISYHGGPVMLGNVAAYYIWYGNWSGNSATTILTDLISHIGGSPYYNINTTYYNGSNQHVANVISYLGSTTNNYSNGTNLSDANIRTIVSNAISSGALPSDANGVYFVLTSADVNETSGFCTQYCGWHTHASISGKDIKYAFIGNPDRCPSACEFQTTGPNGNAGADGMASIISHELEEATSDPDLNAWYDSRGRENADKCAWTFGTTYTTANGSLANMKLGTRDYLIQRNWVNASGGKCAVSYP